MTLLNAAAALQVADVADSWEDGVRLAAAAIDDGRATAKLDAWIELSQAIAGEAA